MATETAGIIECPRCGQKIPSASPRCQFCGTIFATDKPLSTGGVVILDSKTRNDWNLGWKEYGYIGLTSIIVLYGLYEMLIGVGVLSNTISRMGGAVYLGIAGFANVVLGAGALMQQSWAQMILKWLMIIEAIS
ncbi:MAG: hypothetical protein HY248_00425, partial [Fimbriimonas ginsengisoli]|nr:hypothetical protein [Fimbriimonas ginsengisoli]